MRFRHDLAPVLLAVLGVELLSAAPARADEAPRNGSTVVRGVSWDIMGGGVPRSGALLEVSAGFSSLPRASYHYTLQPRLSVGGSVGFDYGLFRPGSRFDDNLVLAGAVRWQVHRDQGWTIGARAEPGVVLGFGDGFTFGLLANVGVNAGYLVEDRLIVGGGVDVPLLLSIPTRSGRPTVFAVPLLVGPVAEFHVTPPLAITAEAKVGPYLATDDVRLGLKLALGLAYRM